MNRNLLFATAWRLLLSKRARRSAKDCSALHAEQRRAGDLADLSRGLRRLGVSPPRELTRKRGRFYAMSEVPWPSSVPARCDAAPRPYRPTMPISKVFAELASGVAQATGKPLTFASRRAVSSEKLED